MSTQTIDYDALAQQHGAIAAASVDYDALAAKHGAIQPEKPMPPANSGLPPGEIPLTSYGAATLQGLANVGKGVNDALAGTYQTIRHPIDTAKAMLAAPGQLVDQARQVPGAIRDINRSADPTGTYLKVAGETAGQGGGQAVVAAAPSLLEGARLSSGKLPERMYQSALKPSTTLAPGKVERMVQTGLQEGIPVSESGAEKIGSLIDDLNDKIKTEIGSGEGVTIDRGRVAARLGDTAKKFSNQVAPQADLKAISDVGKDFLSSQPSEIPAAEAQALKQGTYAQLKGKAYGELKGATIEAQKSLARGIKEELATAFPELKSLNAQEGRLLDLQPILEKAVQRMDNHQMLGMGGPIAGIAGKVATGSSAVGAASMMLKAIVDDPIIKSRLAIALSHSGGLSLPAAFTRIATYSGALGGVSANSEALSDRANGQQ